VTLSVTVLVPAFNEEEGIRDALDALLAQTRPAERVIVVDDCSTDRTAEICAGYPVEVLRTPRNAGSKARALNYALPHCRTDLAMVMDGDTFLAPDYLERLAGAFADPEVTVAAGVVLSKNVRTPAERGRSVELLFASGFYRPIQNWSGAPMVIPGCATLYRLAELRSHGGWSASTVCEDIEHTWVAQLSGEKVAFVPDAVVWTVDPPTGPMLGRQVNRWMSSVFQSCRLHWKDAPRKPLLALWVLVMMVEALLAPVYLVAPFLLPLIWPMSWLATICWWLGGTFLLTIPPVAYVSIRNRLNPLPILPSLPFIHYTRLFNAWYTLRAMVVELVLVPLHLSAGMTVFEKGHA